MRQRSVSPRGGLRENHRVCWPKIMSDEQKDAWYARIDAIRRRALAPSPKRLFLPAARILVAVDL
jgi:hypothetical protein